MSLKQEPTSSDDEDISTALIDIFKDMRAFARSLTKEQVLADDLVQEATLRALTFAHLYTRGTNFKAWIFTIIRNCFYDDLRMRKRFATISSSVIDESAYGNMDMALSLCDFRRAFWKLSHQHREVLILIGPFGLTCDEAAAVCGCAIGTIKSRVCRARARLRQIMQVGEFDVLRKDIMPIATDMDRVVVASALWLNDKRRPAKSAASRDCSPA